MPDGRILAENATFNRASVRWPGLIPGCGAQQLYAQIAGPRRDRTVACGDGRRCTDEGRKCGMPAQPVEVLQHVGVLQHLGSVGTASGPGCGQLGGVITTGLNELLHLAGMTLRRWGRSQPC